jgi:formaldehyde-activating enzyme involved in methanogenesis
MKTTLIKPQYTITIEAVQDDASVIGNASAIDDATDKAMESEILARLESGDVWAWALVTVTVEDDDGRSAYASLGGCSYADARDFRNNSGYFDEMVHECINSLA